MVCHRGTYPKEKEIWWSQNDTKAIDSEDTRYDVTFLTNFAAASAIMLPGKLLSFSKDDI